MHGLVDVGVQKGSGPQIVVAQAFKLELHSGQDPQALVSQQRACAGGLRLDVCPAGREPQEKQNGEGEGARVGRWSVIQVIREPREPVQAPNVQAPVKSRGTQKAPRDYHPPLPPALMPVACCPVLPSPPPPHL